MTSDRITTLSDTDGRGYPCPESRVLPLIDIDKTVQQNVKHYYLVAFVMTVFKNGNFSDGRVDLGNPPFHIGSGEGDVVTTAKRRSADFGLANIIEPEIIISIVRNDDIETGNALDTLFIIIFPEKGNLSRPSRFRNETARIGWLSPYFL